MNYKHNIANFDSDISESVEKAVRSTLCDTYSITNDFNIYRATEPDSINKPYIYCALKIKSDSKNDNIMLLGFSKKIPDKVLENYGFHNIEDKVILNDCIEEISNIIYGKLKKILINLGYDVLVNLPEIIENKTEFQNKYGSTSVIKNAIFCIK